MIKGTTRLTGILGWPVEHSFSPQMHNAAFAALGLDYAYLPLPVRPDDLPAVLAALPAMGFCGVNVTIPHKVPIMDLLTELDSSACLAGAVNTVLFDGARSIGYNTDSGGFIGSLTAAGIEANGARVLLLGAGGAARAVVAGLAAAGATITVAARRIEQATALADLFAQPPAVCGWQDAAFAAATAAADLIVNCTPIGMHGQTERQLPLKWDLIPSGAALCDLIYNPAETPFLAEGRRRGLRTLNGLGMLIEQGALAFERWTGRADCRTTMRQVIEKNV